MTEKEVEKEIDNFKTLCCDSELYRKGRANFRCKKCDKDNSMELLFLYKSLMDEKK